MLGILNSLKAWQIGVLAVVLIGGAGITAGVYVAVSGDGGSGLEEDQQIISVQRGDLVNDISINGSLVFPERESLSFGFQGANGGALAIGEVFVEEGQAQFQEGDLLVTLDSETIAELEKALVQAEQRLRDAEEALSTSQIGATDLQIVQARSDIANAELAYQAAQEDLEELMSNDETALVMAEAAVVNAMIAVEDAAKKLDELQSSPAAADLDDAQQGIASAEVAIDNALADLTVAKNEQGNRVSDAQNASDEASTAYVDVFVKWLGAEVGQDQVEMSPDELLASWSIDLEALFDPDSRFYDIGQFLNTQGYPADDPETPWNEGVIYAWVNFYPGEIVVTCDSGVAPFQGACIRQEMDDAWDAYSSAEDNLDAVTAQQNKAVTAAELAVARTEDDLDSAHDALTELQSEVDSLDVEAAEKQLAVALVDLNTAEDDLASLVGEPDPLEVAASKTLVELAKARIDDAKATLEDLLEGPDPLDLAVLQADIATARASLDTAGTDLETIAITAPFSGVVSVVGVEPGDTVNPNTAVLEIVDPTLIDVQGVVDEIDVLFIQEEIDAFVTLDALAGQVLVGSVSEIGTQSTNQQGVVTYPISIRLDLPQGLTLPEGLTAVASVVLQEDRNVLLVPLDSLFGSFQEPVVHVVNGSGSIEERPVSLGNSDDFWVVVSSGLAEGEQVVMQTSEASTGGFFGGGFIRGVPGGGFNVTIAPGGGGFGGGGGGRGGGGGQ